MMAFLALLILAIQAVAAKVLQTMLFVTTTIHALLMFVFKEKDASIQQSTVTTTTLAQLISALTDNVNISPVVMTKILAQ
jgi:hypothetical protein